MRKTVLSLAFFALASCAEMPKTENIASSAPSAAQAIRTPGSFADLKGWKDDDLSQALVAFKKSCLASIEVFERRDACQSADITAETDPAARAFFENWFQPYAVTASPESDGLFTGYYVPELAGSLQREGVYQTPLYARPSDLVTVDLGPFKSDFKGQTIVGKISGNSFVPYEDRAAITAGALGDRAQPIAWVADPVSAFFLEVQGSGHVRLPDGSTIGVGYDGSNGKAYVAIGRVLADRGELQPPVTMPAIRAWLTFHPQEAQEIMNTNPSYVFFRRLPTDDVLGAEGVPLTPKRSLAVDPSVIPLGTPVWLETTDGEGNPMQQLMVAQDTGGAIKGAVRGDVFWGAGETAEIEAGSMQSRGRYFVLLPKPPTPAP